MLAACGQQCEACGCPSEKSPGGKLFIDHDGAVGNWAVRGLLCTACNVTFRWDRPDPEWATGYLSNPWYVRMLAERGLDANPPEYTDWTLTDSGYLFGPRLQDPDGHIWERDERGWSHGHKKCSPHSWHQLLRRFGPHNLTPFQHPGDVTIPEADVPETRKGLSIEQREAALASLTGAQLLKYIKRAYAGPGMWSQTYESLIARTAIAARSSLRKASADC